MDQQYLTEAMLAYGRALAVADPLRLRLWDDRGLTMPQLRVMFHLLHHVDRPVGELADVMNVRPATMTGLTDRLVRQRLIERLADPGDRRVVRVALTDEGRSLVSEIETASRAFLDEIFERMGEEAVERLVRSFEEFADAASEMAPAEAKP